MKINKKIYIFFAVVLSVVLYGCVSDEPASGVPEGEKGILAADIDPIGPATRAIRAGGEDQWSYVRFSDSSDTVGFYSKKGNIASDGNDGAFINEPLVFSRAIPGAQDKNWRGVFTGVNMSFNPDEMLHDNTTFLYFPYSQYMDGNGVQLRKEVIVDGKRTQRCVDALYMMGTRSDNSSSGALLSGSFGHAFSELMITRGYGFDEPKAPEGEDPWQIRIVLNKGYTHYHIIDNNTTHQDYWKLILPYYNEEYGLKAGLTEKDCRVWEVWEGESFKPTELSEPIRAWYCILPTALSTNRSTVDYIELYDNMGNLQTVTSFSLYEENSKRLQPTQRYQLQVVMEGLVPTIYPYAISPWEDVTSVTDERSRGINDPSELSQFISIYNSYISSDGKRNPDYESQLVTYGDRYETDGEVGWHFYIGQSFDLSALHSDQPINWRINNLCDTIDGMGHTLSSIRITDDSGFIGELRDKGCIMDLNVTGLTVTNSSGAQPTGGLVDIISGGLITGCMVNGDVRSPGVVGMAAGQMTGGRITGCDFRGLLLGGSTFNRLLGRDPTLDNSAWSNNSYGNVVFANYN